jgi:hypothetical protein
LTKKSPVWPPFPGFGYAGAYEPVVAAEMAAQGAVQRAATGAAQASRAKGLRDGEGWGKGAIQPATAPRRAAKGRAT